MDPQDTRELSPNRLVKLEIFLDGNSIPPLKFLHQLVIGEAPCPIALGEELYLGRSDAASWNARLQARAARRRVEILQHAVGGDDA